jgi:hypothetical protein
MKCYSVDGNDYSTSRDAVFEQLQASGDFVLGVQYYETECEPIDMAALDIVDCVLDEFDNHLAEELGECYDNDFSNVDDNAKDELKQLLNAWAEKHVNLDQYWRITGEPVTKSVTAWDIEHEGIVPVDDDEEVSIQQAADAGRITQADDSIVTAHYETCQAILDVLGYESSECLVTDESMIGDFIGMGENCETMLDSLQARFGVEVHTTTTLASLCKIIDHG